MKMTKTLVVNAEGVVTVSDKRFKVEMATTRDACLCGSCEYYLYDFVHTIKIECKGCASGYFVYLDGHIVRFERSSTSK